MEAGMDSLAASEVVQSIGGALETELPSTLLFDHPSIAAICQCVEQQPAAAVAPPDAGKPRLSSRVILAV